MVSSVVGNSVEHGSAELEPCTWWSVEDFSEGVESKLQSWRRRGRGGSRWRKRGRVGSRRVFRAHHMLLISPAIRVDSGLWASSPATEMVHEGPVRARCSGPSPRTLVSQHPPLPHPSRSIPWPPEPSTSWTSPDSEHCDVRRTLITWA